MSTFQLRNQTPIDWLSSLGTESAALAAFCLADNQQPLASIRHHNPGSTQNAWLQLSPKHGFGRLMVELYRVLRTDHECFILLNSQQLATMQLLGQGAGFRLGPLRVVMFSNRRGNCTQRLLLHLRKGRPPASWQQQQTLFELPVDQQQQIPYALMKPLLAQFTRHNDLIIDPLMMDSSVAINALRQQRRFAGAQQDSDKFADFKSQLNQLPGVTELMQQSCDNSPHPATGQMALI